MEKPTFVATPKPLNLPNGAKLVLEISQLPRWKLVVWVVLLARTRRNASMHPVHHKIDEREFEDEAGIWVALTQLAQDQLTKLADHAEVARPPG